MSRRGWIGFDFDGTLSKYDGFKGQGVYGDPIPGTADLARAYLAAGWDVRVVTARAEDARERRDVAAWCERHLGVALVVQAHKDYEMVALFDDRAVAVEKNTGRILGGTLP